MRRTGLVSTAILLLLGTAAIDACGDKFLLVGRGLAFGRAYASIVPGSIVIFSSPASQAQQKKLHDNIRKAGHRVTLITSPSDLHARLRLEQTDIVIADAAAKITLDQETTSLSLKPSVLYLVADAGAARPAAPSNGDNIVKNGEKPGRFLVVIEDIMKARQQAGVRVKRG